MMKKLYLALSEKYEILKKKFVNYQLLQTRQDSAAISVEAKIKSMPTDYHGNPYLIASKNFNGIETCLLNKSAGNFSGNYCNSIDIGEGKIAIIQCDISGKGLAASLISIVVVSLFNSYCLKNTNIKNWSSRSLIYLIEEMNTVIENMKLQGRFAAIQLGIIDSIKKEYISTNAGLNVLYVLRNNKRLKKVEFPDSPAAGVFSADMVNMSAGFKLSSIKLQQDDILLFPGDGFEESQRYNDYNEIEEFGIDRLERHINAIFRKKAVSVDWISVDTSPDFLLDYSIDSGKLEDSLSSLLATEFLYRLKKEPANGWNNNGGGSIPVNKEVVDALLRITPSEFSERFIERSENEEGHEIYSIDKEKIEPQFDDLFFMAVRFGDSLTQSVDPLKVNGIANSNESLGSDYSNGLEEIDELEEVEELVELDELEEFRMIRGRDKVVGATRNRFGH